MVADHAVMMAAKADILKSTLHKTNRYKAAMAK